MPTMATTPPWKRRNPKQHHAKLTEASRRLARARAQRAGRAYPNLVDNMYAAKLQAHGGGGSPHKPARRRAGAKKSSPRTATAKRATANGATAKRATAKRSTAKRSTAKASTATRASARRRRRSSPRGTRGKS